MQQPAGGEPRLAVVVLKEALGKKIVMGFR